MRSVALAALFAITSATCEESFAALCKKLGADNDTYGACEVDDVKRNCDGFRTLKEDAEKNGPDSEDAEYLKLERESMKKMFDAEGVEWTSATALAGSAAFAIAATMLQ